MKKFIKNIAIFSTLLFSINCILFFIAYTQYYAKYEEIELDYSAYLLADSRGEPLEKFTEEYGIYNLSEESESYFDMLQKVKFLAEYSKVQKIIISVDDHTLSPYREKLNNKDRAAFFIVPNTMRSRMEWLSSRFKRFFVLLNPKSRDIIRLYLASLVKNNSPPKSWNDRSEEQRRSHAKNRANLQFRDSEASEQLTLALDDIIQLCKDRDIELVGIMFPLTKEYTSEMNSGSYGAAEFARKNGIAILGFRDFYSSKPELFSNQDHLNELGGRRFAKEIAVALGRKK